MKQSFILAWFRGRPRRVQIRPYGCRIVIIRPHETLSRGKDRIHRPKTPAMAAKVVDHQWTFSELLAHSVLVNNMGT